MRAPVLTLVATMLSLGSGCGAASTETSPRSAASPAPLDGGGGRWLSAPQSAPTPVSARVLFRQQPGSILIGEKAPPPAPERPRTRGRVDVSFHRADLENALRFLADAGRFNLVVESGLTGSVTAELAHVDAFDALVTIAHANGASVDYERGIVLVHRPKASR